MQNQHLIKSTPPSERTAQRCCTQHEDIHVVQARGTITLIGITLSQIPLWYASGSARFLVLWLVAIGLSAVCAWRVPPPQRWLVGLGCLVSFLSVLFISMHTGQRSGWWFILISLLGVVLVKLYLALSKRAVPLPATGALPDQTLLPHSRIARWWRSLVAILIPLHALSLGLYWAYTDHACSRFDLVRRAQGCALVRTPPTFPANTYKVQISPSGALVASVAADQPVPWPSRKRIKAYQQQLKTEAATISLWDLKTGQVLQTLKQPTRTNHITFSPNDQFVAMGGFDEQMRVWRVDDGRLLHTIPDVRPLAFSLDGSILASTVEDTNIHLWSMRDRTLLGTITLDENVSNADIMFSPDGSLLAARGFNEVTLWRVADGTLQRTIETDQGNFASQSLSFSPDSQMLVTAGGEISIDNHTVRLWRVADGTLLHTLNVNPVLTEESYPVLIGPVSFSPDGTRVAAGAVAPIAKDEPQHTILIWRVADGALLEHIQPNFVTDLLRFNDDNTVLQLYDEKLYSTMRVYDQRLT